MVLTEVSRLPKKSHLLAKIQSHLMRTTPYKAELFTMLLIAIILTPFNRLAL